MILTDSGLIYFTAEVDITDGLGGTERLEGVFSMPTGQIGESYCTANPNLTGEIRA